MKALFVSPVVGLVAFFFSLGLAPEALAVDTTPPVITINGLNPTTVFVGNTYNDPGATAQDDVSGSVAVTTTGSVNTAVVGSYVLTYTATDGAMNSAMTTRTVNVVSTPAWAENFLLGGITGSVNAIVESADAYFYGGNFNFVGNVAANNILRRDKTTGAVTALGSGSQNGTNNTVNALALIGTDLYVGGAFTTVSSSTQNAISANYVARWDTTTGAWSPLGSAAQNGTDAAVNALAVLGSFLYVGGDFITVNSTTQSAFNSNHIARWNPAANTWARLGVNSANGNGTADSVMALTVDGTNLYVGGAFTNVNDSTQHLGASHVALWNTTTSIWSPLGNPFQNGTNNTVRALVMSGTTLFVGGDFDAVSSNTQNGIFASHIAFWGGSTWTPIGSATQNGTNGSVRTLSADTRDVYVGGTFTIVRDSTHPSLSANNVVALLSGSWTPMGSAAQNGANDTVNAVLLSGTSVFAGGNFTAVSSNTQNDFTATAVAVWKPATNLWQSAVPALIFGDGFDGTVNAVVDAGSVVYVGGSFSHVGNVAANNVACLTKATRIWTALGSAAQNGTNGTVNALILFGTDLYVGGDYTTVSSSTQNGTSANRVARWNNTAGTWSQLGSAAQNGANDVVRAFAVVGTTIYAGGSFTTVSSSTQNALSAKRIVGWDTAASTWAALGAGTQNGTNNIIRALAVMGTKLYAGGPFTTVSSATQNAISANRIASWDTAASTWSPLGSAAQNGASDVVRALAVTGTNLFAGGDFIAVSSATQNAVSANRIASWDTAASTWSRLGSAAQNGTSDAVRALAATGSNVYVGGNFLTVSSSAQTAASMNHLARWNPLTSAWLPVGSAVQNGVSDTVNALAVIGADLYAGGDFVWLNSTTQSQLPSFHLGIYQSLGPAIVLEQPAGVSIANGGSRNLGMIVINSSISLIFTITNPGEADLTGLTITKDGANPGDFNVTVSPTAPVSSSGSTTFTVQFAPTIAGAKSAAMRITSNAPGSSPFDINLSGTALTVQEAWRQQYFGITTNTGNAADTADPDGDGNTNLFEFVAGLIPNDATSRFKRRIETVAGQPTQKKIIFSPLVAGRTYVVKSKTSLTSPTWTALTSSTTSDVGAERTVLDLAAGTTGRDYMVEVTLP